MTKYWFTLSPYTQTALKADTDAAVAFGATQMIFCPGGVLPPEWVGVIDPATLPVGYTQTVEPLQASQNTLSIQTSVPIGKLATLQANLNAAGIQWGMKQMDSPSVTVNASDLRVAMPIIAAQGGGGSVADRLATLIAADLNWASLNAAQKDAATHALLTHTIQQLVQAIKS
jgi:hypothetical protein